jgi:uncharacterized membrane protein YpjA
MIQAWHEAAGVGTDGTTRPRPRNDDEGDESVPLLGGAEGAGTTGFRSRSASARDGSVRLLGGARAGTTGSRPRSDESTCHAGERSEPDRATEGRARAAGANMGWSTPTRDGRLPQCRRASAASASERSLQGGRRARRRVDVWSLAHRVKTHWGLLVPVLVADVAGMAFGWYYYYDVGQFDPASSHYVHGSLWPLVADSPNAVLLFFVSVLLYRTTGWRSKWLDASAFVLNLYVGLWTTFLFLSYPERMGTFDWGGTNNILFFSHIGMPLQALVLVQDMRRDTWSWPAATAVVVASGVFVWVDYWGPHIHPAPFLHASGDAVLHAGSPWLMVIAVAAWFAVIRVRVRRDRDGPGRDAPRRASPPPP